MKLQDCEFVRLLPMFMREDSVNVALASIVDTFARDIATLIRNYSVWNHIEDLTEDELDELAWEMNILWYRKSANIETKIDVIKNARTIQRKLGTKWAVEKVIEMYFGTGRVLEWYEYGGEPGHFKIQTHNSSLVDENQTEFLTILEQVKRKSAVLDVVEVLESSSNELVFAIFNHDTTVVTNKLVV